MLLLDTHAVVWMAFAPERLSAAANRAIIDARRRGNALGISTQSLYEIARGVTRGRIEIYDPIESFFEQLESKLVLHPITIKIAIQAAGLPSNFPGDPMDRIIAATALTEGIPLITADENIRRSGVVKTIW